VSVIDGRDSARAPAVTPWTRTGAVRIGLLVAALAAAGLVVEHHPAFAPYRFAVRRDPAQMPSTTLAPREEVLSGRALLSLYVAPRDLHDPVRGLFPNKLKHGAEWERPGTVSFFEHGELRFSSGVGVRFHGGGSRITVAEPGFRLYFRRRYGAEAAPAGAVFDDPHDHPLRRLILHNDVRRDQGIPWHLVNPLAYDIAAAIGGITAATKPARMFLNGEFQGVYVLTEHFHPNDYFETHWRHPVRMSAREFDELWRTLAALERPRMAEVARLVDLDNLTRWAIATIFCATFDPFQGPSQYRDPTREDGQWFFVNWDMDGSFRDVRHDTFSRLTQRIAERRRARRENDPRPYLLTRLLAEDPDYQDFFKRRWVEAMNHRIPPPFLHERFEYYRDVAVRYGVRNREYLRRLESFLERRPAVVRALAEQWLNTPPSVKCRVTGSGVRVNGFAVASGFEGYYFPGMRIVLEIAEPARSAFAHWRVNGAVRESHEVTLTAEEDLEIEAVPRPGQ
jgi:hypothetical protein